MIKAINPVHQSKVNKAVRYLLTYNRLNDLRDSVDGVDEKLYKKYDRQCINVFEKYMDALNELPKREQLNIEKSEIY